MDGSLYADDIGLYNEPSALFTQYSEAWPVPCLRPVPKRKVVDILEVLSTSKIKGFDIVASDDDLLSNINDSSININSTHSDLKLKISPPMSNLEEDFTNTVLLMKTLLKSQKICCTTDLVRT